MYNKSQFRKMNEKKVLHKVRKHWVVVSAALLMMIGGKVIATQSAHADVNNQSNAHDSVANTVKNQLNANLVKANQPAKSSAGSSSTGNIVKQATALHSRILANNARLINDNHQTQNDVHNNDSQSTGVSNSQVHDQTSVGRQNLNSNSSKVKTTMQSAKRTVLSKPIDLTKPTVKYQKIISDPNAKLTNQPVSAGHRLHRLLGGLLHSSADITGRWLDMHNPNFEGAEYSLDPNTGALTIANGQITRFTYFQALCPNDPLVQNESKVKSIVYRNVQAPSDMSAYDGATHFMILNGGTSFGTGGTSGNRDTFLNNLPVPASQNGEFFPNQPNLTSIDASGLNTSNVSEGTVTKTVYLSNGSYAPNQSIPNHGMFGTFANMPHLQSLILGSNFKTDQANMSTGDMFVGDDDLKQLTLAQGVNINPNDSLVHAGNLPKLFQGIVDMNNDPHQTQDANGQSYINDIENGTQPAGTYYKDPATNIWGTAFWKFDSSTGTLTVSDGKINRFADFASQNPNSPLVKNESAIKHVIFKNVEAPSDCSAYDEHIVQPSGATELVKDVANGYSIDNSTVPNDGEFFPNQRHLQTVDVSGLDTSHVKAFQTSQYNMPFYDNNGMDGMFSNMGDLTSIKFGGKFNVATVPSMVSMFQSDPDLVDINLSDMNFDPQSVSDMKSMFESDKNLSDVNLGHNFNTVNTKDMSLMFRNDSNLQNIQGLGDLDTQNVADMSMMFSGDGFLMNTDFSNWDTHNVTDMHGMFSGVDEYLITPHELNLANFDTRNVKNMHGMFEFAKFKKLILGDNHHSFDTSNVTDIGSMFAGMSDIKSIGFSSKNNVVLGYHFYLPNAITYGDWTYSGPDITKPNYKIKTGIDSFETVPIDLKSSNPTNNPLENPKNWYSSASMTVGDETIHPGFIGHNSELSDISLSNLRPKSFDGESLMDSDNNLKVIDLANFYLAGPEIMSWNNSTQEMQSDGEMLTHPGVTNTPGIGSSDSNPYKNYDMLTTGPSTQELVAINLGPKINFKKASDPAVEDPNQLPGGSASGANYLEGTFFHYNPQQNNIDEAENMADGNTRPGEWFRDRDGVSVVMYYDNNDQQVGDIINAGKFNSKSDFKTYLDGLGIPSGYYADPNKNRQIFTEKEKVQTDASGQFYVGIIHLTGRTIHGSMYIPANLYNSDGTVLEQKTQVPVKMNFSGPAGTQFYPNNSDVPGTIHEDNHNYVEADLEPFGTHGTITPSDAIYWYEGNEPTAEYRETSNMTDRVIYYTNNNRNDEIASDYFSGKANSIKDVTEANAINIPDHYTLVNPDNQIKIDGQTQYIPIQLINDNDTISFRDIYSDVDGLTSPKSSYTVTNPLKGLGTYNVNDSNVGLPSGWALVDNNGHIITPGEDDFQFDNGNHVLNVAPVYDGLTYKYDKANGFVEFIDGKTTWNGLHYGDIGIGSSFLGNKDSAPSYLTNATSIKFDSDADLNNITDASAMFYGNSAVHSIIFPNSFTAKNVSGMRGMFNSDTALSDLVWPTDLDTSKVNDMSNMFSGDHALASITLPSGFNTSHVNTMNSMFTSDYALKSLTLPSNFDTSHVTNMNAMFESDGKLQSLTLPVAFDTTNVQNMSDMFSSDNNTPNKALHKLVIQSPKTKLIDRSGTSYGINLGNMYKDEDYQPYLGLDSKGRTRTFYKYFYTSPYTNDFSKGNVGTFVRPANPAKNDIFYEYDDDNRTIGTGGNIDQVITGDYGSDVDITYKSSVPGHHVVYPHIVPGYHLANSDNYVQIDGTKETPEYDIEVLPNQDTDTIDYQYNNKTVATGQLTGNDEEAGFNYSFTINNNNRPGLPSKYYLVHSNQTFNYTKNGKYIVPVKVYPDTIVYSDIYHNADGLNPGTEQISDPDPSQPGSRTYTLNSSNIPQGWALVDNNGRILKSDKITYNQGTHDIKVAPIHDGLTYRYNNIDKSVKFMNGTITWNGNYSNDNAGTSFMGENDNAPAYLNNAPSIDFSSDVNLNNMTNTSGMFFNNDAAKSITLPNTFTANNVSDMQAMFKGDSYLTSLNLPNNLNLSKVTNMANMFAEDNLLPILNLPSDFNTSHVTNMSRMFESDDSLHSLTLPASFDTSNVQNMSDMFGTNGNNSNNVALRKLIIKSPKTKLYDKSGSSYGIALGNLYQLDSNGDGYTSANANDFSQGNVGTFVRPANPKVVLTVQYKDQVTSDMLPASDDYTLANQIPGTKMTFADLGISNLDTKTGQHYKVIPSYTYQNFIKPTVTGTIDQTITVPVETTNVVADGQWDGANSAYYTLTSDGTLTFSNHGKASDSQMRTSSWSYAKNSDGQLTFQDDGFNNAAGALNRNSVKHVQFQGNVELPSTGTDHKGLFENMNNLTSFDAMNAYGSDVLNAENLFASDPELTALDLSSLTFANNKSTRNMFHSDSKLVKVSLSNNDDEDTQLSDISGMFHNDPKLAIINNLNGLNTNNVNNMSSTFASDKALPSDFEIPDWQSMSVANFDDMFANDSSIKTLNIKNMMTSSMANDSDAFSNNKLSKVILNKDMHLNGQSKLDGNWMSPDYKDSLKLFSPRPIDNPETNLGPNQSATWLKTNEQPIDTKLYNQAHTYINTQQMYQPLSGSTITPEQQLQLPNGYDWAPGNHVSDGITNQNLNYNDQNETAYVLGKPETEPMTVTVNEENGLNNTQELVTINGRYGDLSDDSTDANSWTASDKAPVGYTLQDNHGGVDVNGKLHYNFAQGAYVPNSNGGWNRLPMSLSQPDIHYTAQKGLIHIIFEDVESHAQIQTNTLEPLYTGQNVTLPDMPKGYTYESGPQPGTIYQINAKNMNHTIVINVIGDKEVVPVKFVDQDNHQVGNINYSLNGRIGSSVNLTNVNTPTGYTLNAGQPTTYQISAKDINTKDSSQVEPVLRHVTGQSLTMRVQYELVNGIKLGNVVTVPNVKLGNVVDLTSKDFPTGYILAKDHGNPKHYQLSAADISLSNHDETNVLPVYVIPAIQPLTIDYVNADGHTMLDRRTVSVKDGTQIYLTNNDVTNNKGTNANGSFVKTDRHLMGYVPASNQDLTPTAEFMTNNHYPVYTVKMQSLPVTVYVTYHDPATGDNISGDVGSDVITQTDAGQPILIGDTVNLPTTANANQHGLDSGYTLDDNQPQQYQIANVDTANGTSAVKNIVLLAHGDHVIDKAPVTIKLIGSDNRVQGYRQVTVPIDGEVGDRITFNSSDFTDLNDNASGYIPQGYTMAPDYVKHAYTAELMPNDTSTWQSDSWQISHNGKYWYNPNSQKNNGRPLVALQADPSKSIAVRFFNQNHQQVGSDVTFTGDYGDAVDLKDPSIDNQSALKDHLPRGYHYGSNNQSSMVYGQEPETANVNVTGNPDLINVQYNDPINHQVAGSVDDSVKGYVGNQVTLPTTHLPQGYQLTDGQSLSYDVNPDDEVQPSTKSKAGLIIRSLNVMPRSEVLPIKFVDQNGHQVGNLNYQIHGMIGQTNVALPSAPTGYIYAPNTARQNNPTRYNFTVGQMNIGEPGYMQVHTIYLNGNSESVPVDFVDQNGTVVPNGSTVISGHRIGDTIQLPSAPKGYAIQKDQPTDYTLTLDNVDSAKAGSMKPVKIYVRTAQNYVFNVTANENVNGTFTNQIVTPLNVKGSDGNVETFRPSDHRYAPIGFRTTQSDHPATTRISDTGLTMSKVAWTYDATSSKNNNNPNDQTTAQPIYLTYYDESTHQAIKGYSNRRIDGYMTQTVDVANPQNGGIAIPNGYVLDDNHSTVHQITTTPQHITLNVKGVKMGANDFRVDIDKEFYRTPSDHQLTNAMTSQDVPETGAIDSSFVINPNDSHYVPQGYHLDMTNHARDNRTINGQVTDEGLTPDNHQFYYVAGSSFQHQDGVQPIHVTYYDDQTGAPKGTSTVRGTNVVNGYMNETFNVGQLGTNGLDKGYTVDPNQTQTYTISTQPTNAHVMVHGDQSNNDQITLKLYKEDPYGNVLAGQPSIVYADVAGNTGNQYDVSANDYLPNGYQLDTSHNRDQDLKGTILSNGKLSNNSVNFYYQLPLSNETNLNPIHVMYEDDNDHDIVKDEVITPTKEHDDYVGKFVDVVANDNADNQQSPVPQGYDIDSNQYTQAAFSQKKPTYIDVLVHADQNGTQYNDIFNQIEQFYDGNQLTNTDEQPRNVKGVDGSSFTVDAPLSPVGYVADAMNPLKVNGYVERSRSVPGSALYKFNATNSTDYDHPSDHNHAQPIFVTFKNGNVTVGKSDQRVDGYMNQMVDALTLGHLSLPNGYRLANGANTVYKIGINVQHQVIQVVPKTVSATVNYVDQNNHDLIAQRNIDVPLGTKLASLTNQYIQFVPYDFNYVSHDWNDNTQVVNNGQYTIYVDRQQDRAQPQPASDQNAGIIDVVYQNHAGDSVATYELSNVNAQPFNAADYIKARSKGGQMPDGFSNPKVISQVKVTKFDHTHPQTLVVQVVPNGQLASATVEYEDAKTHQLIKGPNDQPLSTIISGQAGDVINYENYRQFVPQGYTYYGMGDHDDVIEDGDADVIMVRKAKPAERIGQINVTYKDSKGHVLDTVNVSGIVGKLFNLDYYENDLPTGYEFNGVDKDAVQFADHPQDITIKIDQPKVQNYGKVTIHFVRANAEGVSPAVNGNRATSDKTLESYEVPNDVDEVMTGHIGDLFSPAEYEHNTPQGTTFDHIVKGDDISEITKAPQDLWIAVQATKGQF